MITYSGGFSKCIRVIILTLLLFLPAVFISAAQNHGSGKKLADICRGGKVTLKSVQEISLDTLPEEAPVKNLSSLFLFNNQLVFADSSSNVLFILSRDGQFIKTVGREGKGPGDLYIPTYLCVSKKRLVVYESGNQRFSFFSPEWTFLKTEKPSIKGIVQEMRALSDGRIIVDIRSSELNGEKNDVIEKRNLELFSSELAHIKTLYSEREKLYKPISKPRRMMLSNPFATVFSWDILPGDKLVAGFPSSYEFFIMDMNTGVKKKITRDWIKDDITETDKNDYFNSRFNMDSGALRRGASAIVRENTVFPSFKPAYKKIFAGQDGHILVFIFSKGGQKGLPGSCNIMDVFDREGKFVQQVTLSEGIQTFFFLPAGDCEFWSMVENDNGEHGFVKYKFL